MTPTTAIQSCLRYAEQDEETAAVDTDHAQEWLESAERWRQRAREWEQYQPIPLAA